MRTFRFVVFLFAILFTCKLSAQMHAQAAADIRLVNNAFIKNKSIQMNIGYTLFPGYTSTVPFEKQDGVFMKQGDNTYSSLLGIVSVRNSNVSLTVDSNEQAIVVTDPPTKSEINPALVNLDSLLKICSSVEYRDLDGKGKFYKLKFDKAQFFEYNAIDIYINKETNFLDKLILYFRVEVDLNEEDDIKIKDRPRLEIDYTDVTTTPVFTKDQFSEKQYIRISGKTISSTPSYASYRLVNNKIH